MTRATLCPSYKIFHTHYVRGPDQFVANASRAFSKKIQNLAQCLTPLATRACRPKRIVDLAIELNINDDV